MATPELILACRREVGDVDPSLPILADSEYEYFLDSNNNSVARASIQAAKTILFKLSINASDETISVLSLKGSKAAAAYLEALKFYVSNPSLNPLYNNLSGWIGNTSRSEMLENNSNPDNYVTSLAVSSTEYLTSTESSNTFSV